MLRWSWMAGTITAIYAALAIYVVQDELRHTGGGWINLRGMAVAIVTVPSQVTLGNVLRAFGIPKVNYNEPKVGDFLELAAHVLLSALFIYLVVLGIELLIRRLLAPG